MYLSVRTSVYKGATLVPTLWPKSGLCPENAVDLEIFISTTKINTKCILLLIINTVSTFLYTQIHSTASQLFRMSLVIKQVTTLNNAQKHSSGCKLWLVSTKIYAGCPTWPVHDRAYVLAMIFCAAMGLTLIVPMYPIIEYSFHSLCSDKQSSEMCVECAIWQLNCTKVHLANL